MSIRNLSILAGGMFLLTIAIFVFTANPPKPSSTAELSPTPALSVAPTENDSNEAPKSGMGKISGNICNDDVSKLSQGIILVAERQPDRNRVTKFIPGPIIDTLSYSLDLKPGNYEIYIESFTRDKIALYSNYVVCGKNLNTCLDHNLIQVGVTTDQIISDVNVCDYDWSIKLTPSPENFPTITTSENL